MDPGLNELLANSLFVIQFLVKQVNTSGPLDKTNSNLPDLCTIIEIDQINTNKMNISEIKILETGISIILFILIRMVIIKIIDKTVKRSLLHKTRGKIIKKVFQIILVTIVTIFILTVWGVDQSKLFMFMASVLTVLGLALFAQWSHLSNVTSGIIIFFNHSVKLDDTVSIIDKDFEVEGRISDIGLFFVKLKSKNGEEVSLPNNIFLQKMIKKKPI